jgi:hypothetical protein
MEAIDGPVVILDREQFVDQPRDYIRAKGQPSRSVMLLLPLEPSPLEKRLMTENVRRRPNLTE